MLYEEGRFANMKTKVEISNDMWLFAPCVLIGLSLGIEYDWLVLLPTVILHELGHYLAARIRRIPLLKIHISLWGVRMNMGGILSYQDEFWLALGGPLANLLCAAISRLLLAVVPSPISDHLALFFSASVGLALFNLLPLGTLDGGRILSSVISRFFSPEAAHTVLSITTGLCLTLLWLFSAYALLKGAPMLSLFAFAMTFLLQYMTRTKEKTP